MPSLLLRTATCPQRSDLVIHKFCFTTPPPDFRNHKVKGPERFVKRKLTGVDSTGTGVDVTEVDGTGVDDTRVEVTGGDGTGVEM
jgi:hypothetical protein